jgi:PTH1 family peptidyl-tRNA hydrolase
MPFRKPFAGGPRFAADWLVVGLGNTGEEHTRNRHNVGFRVVNELAKRAGAQPKATGGTMNIGVGDLAGQKSPSSARTFTTSAAGRRPGAPVDRLRTRPASSCTTGWTLPSAPAHPPGRRPHGNNGLRASSGRSPDFSASASIHRPVVAASHRDPATSPPSPAPRRRSCLLVETAIAAADAIEAVIAEGVDAAGSRFNRR